MIDTLRYCLPDSHNPYENLALEYWLMKEAKPHECILSLWRNARTVVIGRNQNMHRECRVDALEADGGHLARRMSGGGAVFHDLGNLNFSFLVRDPDYDVRRQLSVIAEALVPFGLSAEISGRNDVTVGGRKISGNAFLREGAARCHHGTLLVSVSSADMMRYLTPDPGKLASKGVSSVRSRVVNLQELVPALTVETVIPELIAAFGRIYGHVPTVIGADEIDRAEVGRIAAMLSSPAWLVGKEPQDTLRSARHYFPFGSAELSLTTEKGTVTDAVLYTDALDETLSETVRTLLSGVPCRRDALEAAVRAANLEKSTADGLCQLICEVVSL